MNITLRAVPSKDKTKNWYTFEWGKAPDQRRAAHIFTYAKSKCQLEKNHNKEALALLSTKQSQLILEQQAIGTGYIPTHKHKVNFFEYYDEYVRNNKREGNRHLEGSLVHFRAFIKMDFLHPNDITENLSVRFRQYLLDKFNGETPANYFAKYKKVIKAAIKDGYFRLSPAEDIAAKSNRNKK